LKQIRIDKRLAQLTENVGPVDMPSGLAQYHPLWGWIFIAGVIFILLFPLINYEFLLPYPFAASALIDKN